MDFSEILRLIKSGYKVQRTGWNGKGMFIFVVPGSAIEVSEGRPLSAVFQVGTKISYDAHIDMFTAQGTVIPWLASQADLMAQDWEVVGIESH